MSDFKQNLMADQNQTVLLDKRERIDQIDAGILALIHERMQLAAEIATIKSQVGLEIEDLDRENELYAKLATLNQDSNVPNEKLLEIWGKIIELSKKIQGA